MLYATSNRFEDTKNSTCSKSTSFEGLLVMHRVLDDTRCFLPLSLKLILVQPLPSEIIAFPVNAFHKRISSYNLSAPIKVTRRHSHYTRCCAFRKLLPSSPELFVIFLLIRLGSIPYHLPQLVFLDEFTAQNAKVIDQIFATLH